MITINYQRFGTKGFQLRLRLYQDGETKYINVTRLLKGAIKRQHWNPNKQLFTPGCPFSEENNAILASFKQKYQEAAINWNGSVFGLITSIEETAVSTRSMNVSQFIQFIIEGLNQKKHKDGSIKGSFENYIKLDKRLQEYCKSRKIQYEKLLITEVSPVFIQGVLEWVMSSREGKGMGYISKNLHSVIMKADKEGYLKADDFKGCSWYKRPKGSSQKYFTLTDEQCKRFAELNLDEIANTKYNELYRDFCFFLLYTGQSPCDALCMKYSDIKRVGGFSHFIFRRRKIAEKQTVPCAVPINSELDKIMLKWRHLSKDGYIFPIRTKEKIETQVTNNGDIKHFIGNLNYWLKKVGKAIGCEFPLHTYVFRHTAITRYISSGVPVLYVANMMGTSVENCQTIYYNNQGDIASRNKVLAAMKV